jgi:phosphoenolpyruvate phosphomutase
MGKACGRWIGMLRARGEGIEWLNAALTDLKTQPNFQLMGIPDLCNYLIDQGKPIRVIYINGHWLDVNSLEDLERAVNFTQFNS